MKGYKWSEEAVLRNRRKRMARRLYKSQPLFATAIIGSKFEMEYNESDLFADLPLKNNSRSLKRKAMTRKPNEKANYVNYLKDKIGQALMLDDQKEVNRIINVFYQIQNQVSKPWKVEVRVPSEIEGATKIKEYSFSNQKTRQVIQHHFINRVNSALKSGGTEQDVDRIFAEFQELSKYGK